jgi:hypothetical protein
MENCSYFIKDTALFGAYPTQDEVDHLESIGVRHFVDLTCPGERKIIPYTTKHEYISYPIQDHRYPYNWYTFSRLIVRITEIISELTGDEKIYIGCKGGHGRSGIVTACVLTYYFSIDTTKAIELTTMYHSTRTNMKERWRRIGSPQTKGQKKFVYNFFKPYTFRISGPKQKISYLSNLSNNSVSNENGTFSTVHKAYQYSCNLSEEKREIIKDLLQKKMDGHCQIKKLLLNTGLRPIIFQSHSDMFLGSNLDTGEGMNILGLTWESMRRKQYLAYLGKKS